MLARNMVKKKNRDKHSVLVFFKVSVAHRTI